MTQEIIETAPAARQRPQRTHICPECGVRFKGVFDATFCTTKHKDAFHNRQAKRGKIMVPLLLAWRAGRGSTPAAKWAWKEMCMLADGYNAEDVKAGRVPMGAYLKPKMARGWSAADAL